MRAFAVTVLQLPASVRARTAYDELRKMGFGAEYSAFVVEVLENARADHFKRWAVAQRLRLGGSARTWLEQYGYL